MKERLPEPTPECNLPKGLGAEAADIDPPGAVKITQTEIKLPEATDHEREQWIQRYRESVASEMASKLHDEWRQGRLREDGTYEPRIKITTDEAWIEAHGTDAVDIANTGYFELPADWQKENKEAAKAVYDLVDDPETRRLVISAPANPVPVGERVHDAWLNRNEWAAGSELDVPYGELPQHEQVKDIRQVDIAREHLGYTSTRQ